MSGISTSPVHHRPRLLGLPLLHQILRASGCRPTPVCRRKGRPGTSRSSRDGLSPVEPASQCPQAAGPRLCMSPADPTPGPRRSMGASEGGGCTQCGSGVSHAVWSTHTRRQVPPTLAIQAVGGVGVGLCRPSAPHPRQRGHPAASYLLGCMRTRLCFPLPSAFTLPCQLVQYLLPISPLLTYLQVVQVVAQCHFLFAAIDG